MMFMLLSVFFVAIVVLSCDGEVHEHQNREDKRLNEPDEDFQEHEWNRQEIGENGAHGHEKHFTREDVAEQPERERRDFCKLSYKLKNADKERYGGYN